MTGRDVIGITGRLGAGKSTAAAHLRERHGYAGSNLTDPMDEMLAPLLRRMKVPEHEIALRLSGSMKNVPIPGFEWLTGRKLKQKLGLEYRDAISRPLPDSGLDAAFREHDTDRSFFYDLWFDDNEGHARLVNEQVRYDFEADAIRRRGGIVVRIDDPDAVRDDYHPSEDIDFPVDHVIVNRKNGTADLHAALDALVASLPSAQITRIEDPLGAFDAAIDGQFNAHGPEIRAYADRIDDGDEDLSEAVDDAIAEIKGKLGADAANMATDADAEAAIDAAAAWVTDGVSNSTSDRRVAAVYAQFGRDEAVRMLGDPA